MSERIVKEMWESMDASPNLMVSLVDSAGHHEPMRAQLDKDANDEFWFYTTKTNRIAPGGEAMVQFVSKDHKMFACISGTLVAETDPSIIEKYWSKQVDAWYEEGKDDPNLLMMKFKLNDAEIWSVDPSLKGMFKLMTGSNVKPTEMGDHTKVEF